MATVRFVLEIIHQHLKLKQQICQRQSIRARLCSSAVPGSISFYVNFLLDAERIAPLQLISVVLLNDLAWDVFYILLHSCLIEMTCFAFRRDTTLLHSWCPQLFCCFIHCGETDGMLPSPQCEKGNDARLGGVSQMERYWNNVVLECGTCWPSGCWRGLPLALAHSPINASVETDERVEIVVHSPGLASWISHY